MDSGDERYCSHVGVDLSIVLPTKADNRTKTQGTGRNFFRPHLCMDGCLCLCGP